MNVRCTRNKYMDVVFVYSGQTFCSIFHCIWGGCVHLTNTFSTIITILSIWYYFAMWCVCLSLCLSPCVCELALYAHFARMHSFRGLRRSIVVVTVCFEFPQSKCLSAVNGKKIFVTIHTPFNWNDFAKTLVF